MKSVKGSRTAYAIYLEGEKRKNQIQYSQSALRELANELSSRKRRYAKLEEESKHLDANSSKLMDKAEIKNEMKYVTEGNILKRAVAEKREEMNLISSEIQELELKRQKIA